MNWRQRSFAFLTSATLFLSLPVEIGPGRAVWGGQPERGAKPSVRTWTNKLLTKEHSRQSCADDRTELTDGFKA